MVARDELGGMSEHSARPAGRIEDGAAVRLDNLDNQLHDRGRREILAALLHVRRGELPHEIFEDQPIGVPLDREGREQPQQLAEHRIGQRAIALRQHAREVGIGLGDALHRGIERLGEVGRLGQLKQAGKAGIGGEVDRALGLIVGGLGLQPACVIRHQLVVNLVELCLHLPQSDEREDGLGVLIGTQGAVRPQLIGGCKETPRQILQVDCQSFCPRRRVMRRKPEAYRTTLFRLPPPALELAGGLIQSRTREPVRAVRIERGHVGLLLALHTRL